jgi:hypothetical protein
VTHDLFCNGTYEPRFVDFGLRSEACNVRNRTNVDTIRTNEHGVMDFE